MPENIKVCSCLQMLQLISLFSLKPKQFEPCLSCCCYKMF